MFISVIGTWIQIVAQSWLVFQLTNSAFLLGVVGFLGLIPIFLLSLFGGVAADTFNKRSILICTQTVFMLLAFTLAILTHLRLITTWQIMVIAVLNGIVMSFDMPSRQAIVAELVGRGNLLNAIALNSVAFNSSRIIGPALAGILVAAIGMAGCFYVNSISFLAVIFALLLIRINNNSPLNKNTSTLGNLKEGLGVINSNPTILALVCIVGVLSLFGNSYTILMPVFAKEVLNAGVKGLGVLMSSVGIGALISALVLARLGNFRHKGMLMVLSAFIFSVSLVTFSLSKIYLFSIISLIFVGGASVTAIALINTILQIEVRDEFRGRIMSVFMLTFAGIMPFGNLLAGALAHFVGVSYTIMLNGILCMLFFTVIIMLYPRLKAI